MSQESFVENLPMSHSAYRWLFRSLKVLLFVMLAVRVWAQTPPFKQCPAVGVSPSCGVLIVINADNTVSVYSDSSVGPFDATEDTLIGVQNNSSHAITSLPINGGAVPIFGFDGDGICASSTASLGSIPSGCPFGPTGYEGPNVTFTIPGGTLVPCPARTGTGNWQCASTTGNYTQGTVNFTPGIPPGGSAYFGLEESVSAQNITIPLSTTCPASPATVGVPYSSQLVGTGGNGVYTWALALNNSIGNLTLSSSGLVSGTPTSPGVLNFSLVISDTAEDPSQTQACSLQVVPQPLTLNCNPLSTNIAAGATYTASCTASAGTPSYTWSYSNVPSWLTASSNGNTATLTGKVPNPPPASYTPTIMVTDSSPPSQTRSQTLTINVTPPMVTVNCTAPPTAYVGLAYSATCTASSGTAPYSWSYGDLPSWLTPHTNGATVTLTGTPPAPPPASYTFSVSATDSNPAGPQTQFQSITIAVSVQTLSLSCSAPGTAAGAAYSATCTASGGTANYNWSYANLPAWLKSSGSGSTISLSGTVPSPATSPYTPTVTVTDSSAPSQSKSQTLTINVTPPLVTINCSAPATAYTGIAYSATCKASGGTGPYTWGYTNLPVWLTAQGGGSTVILTGTPPAPPPAAYTLILSATDSNPAGPQTQVQPITITIAAPTLTMSCSAPSIAPPGSAYTGSCTASGGTPAYTWTFTNLPSWLASVASGGTVALAGTVPNPPPGSYSFIVTVTDSTSPSKQTLSQTVSITVGIPPLTVSCATPATATGGSAYSGSCAASGGTPGYTWTYSSLPSWLTGGESGPSVTLTGTTPNPPPGSYTFTVTVTDATAPTKQTASKTITITVGLAPLTLSCSAPSAANSGTAYSGSCTASGGTPAFTFTYSNLPSWLTASASGATATLTGTTPYPPPGSYTFTVTVTDATSPTKQTASKTVTIAVSLAPLTMTCTAPAAANSGTAYSGSCTASGGTPAYVWTYSNLPSWLTGGTGGPTVTLAGTTPNPPPGSYTFTVTVTDSTLPSKQTASQTLTIAVSLAPLTVTCSTPTATGGTAYSGSCTASGGTPGYTFTYSNLPSWLTASASGATVALSGTAPNPPPGSYTFTVNVTDATTPTKQSASRTVTIAVSVPPLTVTCSAPPLANAGVTYSGTCSASGGVPPYSWTYSNLPSWLSAGSSGATVTLSGTTPAPPPASYSITATVTDGSSPAQTQSATVSINVLFQQVQGITISQNSSGSAPNQTTISVQFGQPSPATYSGTLTLTFKPDPGVINVPGGYVDPSAGFPVGGQTTTSLTDNFTVPQGQSAASIPFAVGTVAGTWTVTMTSLSGGVPTPTPTFTVSVPLGAPVITPGSVKIVFGSGNSGLTVQLAGYATTRDVASATFTFSAASGAQLNGSSITVPFNGVDQSQWFTTSAGLSAGGTFSLSVPFAYSGDPAAVGSVAVTLTNSRGQTSTAVTGTR